MGDTFSINGHSPNILALGRTKAYPGFSALSNVGAEFSAIVRDGQPEPGLYPGKIYLDRTFITDRLQGELSGYHALHIATYGSFKPKSITDSFLLLGNGDRLPITKVASLNRPIHKLN